MSEPIVICDKLSKSYRLGENRRKQAAGRSNFSAVDAFSRAAFTLIKLLKERKSEKAAEDGLFWALRDVSFEIQPGEVVAVVGRNGAGKSTLLKILSRIVEPTKGVARLRGRVASLLEVGTGFHPELTGRENIYLNGAILGMRKAEIERKFDEIVAFSEIEEFLDTPVKRYSSGMYVRLAFAVAAHLEPEILIVDEVLAVGDYAFQQKCIGKMKNVSAGEGRTILFVSHNMGVLAQLCQYGIQLEDGRVTMVGPVKEVIQAYLRSGLSRNSAIARFPRDLAKPCQYVSVEILHGDGKPGTNFSFDEPVIFQLGFEVREPVHGIVLTWHLQTLEGTRVLLSDVRDSDPSIIERMRVGFHAFQIMMPPKLLSAMTYVLTVTCTIRFSGIVDEQEACCEFTICDLSNRIAPLRHARPGVIGIQLPWSHRYEAVGGSSTVPN